MLRFAQIRNNRYENILVTGSVNGSQNVYCVSDYCQRLWHMYSSIRSESRRPNVKWHLYILPGDFMCGPKLITQYKVPCWVNRCELILNILFFNELRQMIPEIRSERRDLLIFNFILKTTCTFTPVHSAGYLILRNEFRSTHEVARQNIQVSFYIRSTGLSTSVH
jgi:hypothetical protein